MMKFIDWLEKQAVRFTNFLNTAREDLIAFDEHQREEIEKYCNKQCEKAALTGIGVGLLFAAILTKILL